MTPPAPRHPNANASALTLLLAGWCVSLAAHYGLQLSMTTALTIAGGLVWLRLYVGRRGVIGAAREAWKTFLRGSDG